MKDIQFVPVVIGLDRYSELETLGNAVAQAVAAQSEPVLIIASSDMNHYENDDVTREKDKRAIDRILALDPRGLYDAVRSEGITMCGYAATVAMLVALKKSEPRKRRWSATPLPAMLPATATKSWATPGSFCADSISRRFSAFIATSR